MLGLLGACATRSGVEESGSALDAGKARPAVASSSEARADRQIGNGSTQAAEPAVALDVDDEAEREPWRVRIEGLPLVPSREDDDYGEESPVVAYELVGRDGRSLREHHFVEDGFIEIRFHRKRFELAEVRVHGASANGVRFRPAKGFESLPLETDGERVLRYEPAPTTRLIVRDMETGEPIERGELELVRGDEPFNWEYESILEPLYARAKVQNFGRDPIGLDWCLPPILGLCGRVEFAVRAEGRAERRIAVALGSGGTHAIWLQRGAAVQLDWRIPEQLVDLGMSDSPKVLARLESEEETGILAVTSDPPGSNVIEPRPQNHRWVEAVGSRLEDQGPCRRARFEGLAPGTYIAHFSFAQEDLVQLTPLAQGRFAVESGQRVEVELESAFELEALPSRLAFELDVPAEYVDAPTRRVSLCRIEGGRTTNSRSSLSFDRRTGRTGPEFVSPGDYELTVSGDLALRTIVTVGAGTREIRRITIPSPQPFRVRLVTEAAHVGPLPTTLEWRSLLEIGHSRRNRSDAVSGQPGVFEFLAPSASIEVLLPRFGPLQLQNGDAQRLDGGGEHVVTLVPAPYLRFHLLRDGQRITVPLRFKVERSLSDSAGRYLFQERIRLESGFGEEQRVWFPEPGEYELKFRKLEGYEPLPNLAVNVSAGDDRLIELPLVVER